MILNFPYGFKKSPNYKVVNLGTVEPLRVQAASVKFSRLPGLRSSLKSL